ncbi:hypothetical protein XENTR_v10020059 [Xenopus tropicalis]|nr:beta-1,4-galactosyltransferase galt-1-like [Xenopus tropicalis]KAE8582291.1 hypothetical protein XENTR_v10020059 [Xenopus tropicalis]|eukprot:XP_002942008.1 PREDICTED: galactan beta-1,4-galactosyltransferase GALS3-like [Xenopus tropicalis]
MYHARSYKSCVALFLIFLFLLSTYNFVKIRKSWTLLTAPKSNLTAAGSITPLQDNKTLIMSAYYDDRESNNVRIVAILNVDKVKELYCWFFCEFRKGYIPVRAQIDVPSDQFGFPYSAAIVLCKDPQLCFSHHISIHSTSTGDIDGIQVFEIKNREPRSFSANFTVCISTMFGNSSNVLQFVQAIEMYRILGAQKVVIYKNSCSRAIGRAVDYYVSEGVVEVVPWPIDRYLRTSDAWHHDMDPKNEIGYYGQVAALNDCLYRNMYKTKYLTFNDIDEIILPRIHTDWNEMMETLQKEHPDKSVFLIENHYYPIHLTDHTFDNAFPKDVPGRNILQYIYYEPEQPNVYNNHKMIVNPRKVIQTSVHFSLKAYGGNLDVANHIAGLHHSREAKQPNLPFTSLIRDTTLWKYNVTLIRNVNRVLKNLS